MRHRSGKALRLGSERRRDDFRSRLSSSSKVLVLKSPPISTGIPGACASIASSMARVCSRRSAGPGMALVVG
jgi:hypothetical protein